MKALIEGIIEYRKCRTEEDRKLFARLALEQKPNALFVACSDSRVVPNLFASTNPGDLFVLRNIGNLIPQAKEDQENSVGAVLEYSIFSLNIEDIIICGHSECGAMRAITEEKDFSSFPHLSHWLANGKDALNVIKKGVIIDPTLALHNQVSQANVLMQMEHLKTYPYIKEKLEQHALRIHGWWFDIARADVYFYVPQLNKFVQIDETKGKLLLEILT